MATHSDLDVAIRAANDDFERRFAAGDAPGLAGLYTSAGKLLPPNSDAVSGHGGIEAFWRGAMDMGIKSAKLETVQLEGLGGTAVEEGRYTLAAADGGVLDQGKYVVVWKNDGGRWKLDLDIWNSSEQAG